MDGSSDENNLRVSCRLVYESWSSGVTDDCLAARIPQGDDVSQRQAAEYLQQSDERAAAERVYQAPDVGCNVNDVMSLRDASVAASVKPLFPT